MSWISALFTRYKEALNNSKSRYLREYSIRACNTEQFYRDFLHTLIINHGAKWQSDLTREFLAQNIERFFGTRELVFLAIDGSCAKAPYEDFMIYYGGSYGVKGTISMKGEPPTLKYSRWSIDRDVSIVGYVPIPFAQITDTLAQSTDESFLLSDDEKINLSSIHLKVMQLAEVFLAYESAVSSSYEYPRILLLDGSLSSILSATERGLHSIGLDGYRLGGREIRLRDMMVALSHPQHDKLRIPSAKDFTLRYKLISELSRRKAISVSEFAKEMGLEREKVAKAVELLLRDPKNPHAKLDPPLILVNGDMVEAAFNMEDSWREVVRLFEELCERLFRKSDQGVLTYPVVDSQGIHERWMSPDDLDFLISVGLRRLIEVCWERRIWLVGVAKDSAARFFSKHYLGVLRHVGVYPKVPTGQLPWTDRVLLELIPYFDENLIAPWSTVEFDSIFMTLHLESDPVKGTDVVKGMRGWIVVPHERLILRTMAQFYLARKASKSTPAMGHVIFVDRLAQPVLDASMETFQLCDPELGKVEPFLHKNSAVQNPGLAITMYVVNLLTRNLFPEVIGYPDPLHKADWGARSLEARARNLMKSSELAFRVSPTAQLFRTTRNQGRPTSGAGSQL